MVVSSTNCKSYKSPSVFSDVIKMNTSFSNKGKPISIKNTLTQN